MNMSKPKVMGILNVTPDSFYAKSRVGKDDSLKKAEQMLNEGVDFIDIGGYSSRPNAANISEDEELSRVIPVIDSIHKNFPEAVISIDTFRAKVAASALENGAHIINDISGGKLDEKMLSIVGKFRTPYIGMHMRGNPQTMRGLTEYEDLLLEVSAYFDELKTRAQGLGIKDLIIDPGFGFAKTLEQNYYLLKKLSYLKHLDCPILVGVSRKSMIYKLLKIDPEDAMSATSGLNAIALIKGASILRVHDVKEAKELVTMTEAINDSGI